VDPNDEGNLKMPPKKTKSEKIRTLLAEGMRPCEVARRVGVQSGAVASAAKRTGARGRPRKTVHPVEAACRYIETSFGTHGVIGLSDVLSALRSGAWKRFIQPVV
jgi:hypothetical protein